jgi:regulator of protease activity HflC (stomatin/prohibitin superfamily)
VLHAEFEAFVTSVELKPELLARLEAQIQAKIDELRGINSARAERQQANMTRLKRSIDGLIQMRAEGLISSAEFAEQKGCSKIN